jgi:hypothetical protein
MHKTCIPDGSVYKMLITSPILSMEQLQPTGLKKLLKFSITAPVRNLENKKK